MKTLPLILLLGIVLTVLYVLYLRREGRRRREQGNLYEPLADRFGLTLVTLKNPAGLYMWPELGGDYRGREVRVRGGVEFESHFRVRYGEGSEPPGLVILDEAIRRELLSAITAGRPQPFEKLALVGDGLLYTDS